MALGVFLVFLLAFSGNTVIMQYTAFIFSIAGSSLPPNDAAIIIAGMQVLGILIMGLLVDRVGRRFLMLTSCIGSAISLILMAVYMLLKEGGTEMDNQWIPVFLLTQIIIFNSNGISTLLFVMCVEIVPFKVRCLQFFGDCFNCMDYFILDSRAFFTYFYDFRISFHVHYFKSKFF